MTALQHELSCYPLSLFETAELLHEGQNLTFADRIWINLQQKDPPAPENLRYVLDGGALLYRIPWTRGSSFSTILQTYADYVNKRFPGSVIVFDGYEEVSTKDMTHRRRSKGKKKQ